jgi:hypothetical protein
MKIASTARQLPGRKTKDEEYGRNEAFSNRRSSYTFDLPLAGACCLSWLACVPLKADTPPTVAVADPIISSAAGAQGGWVSEELSPDAVKDIPLGAAGLLSRCYIRSHFTAAEEQAVHNKNQSQIQRENPSIHAKSRHYARLWFEAWRHANGVPATVRQEQAIKKADKTLKRFFASLGLPYKPLDVTFIPNNLIPGSLAGGCDSLYSETIFLPVEDSHDFMDIALIHEGIHFNSRGSWPLRLEEGIVETLTEDLIFVNGSIYAPERKAVDCIVGQLRKRGHLTTSAAEKMLATAFLTDVSPRWRTFSGTLRGKESYVLRMALRGTRPILPYGKSM